MRVRRVQHRTATSGTVAIRAARPASLRAVTEAAQDGHQHLGFPDDRDRDAYAAARRPGVHGAHPCAHRRRAGRCPAVRRGAVIEPRHVRRRRPLAGGAARRRRHRGGHRRRFDPRPVRRPGRARDCVGTRRRGRGARLRAGAPRSRRRGRSTTARRRSVHRATLSAGEVAERAPGVTCAPPAAQGDVYRAALSRPVAIGLVDGYFERVPAVWHKEILWALSQGIHVFGSASMGALRAAELAPFGMVGVGAIFEAYRDGIARRRRRSGGGARAGRHRLPCRVGRHGEHPRDARARGERRCRLGRCGRHSDSRCEGLSTRIARTRPCSRRAAPPRFPRTS